MSGMSEFRGLTVKAHTWETLAFIRKMHTRFMLDIISAANSVPVRPIRAKRLVIVQHLPPRIRIVGYCSE